MINWLSFTSDLLGLRKTSDLAAQFINIVGRELALDQAMLLVPNSDGRLLIPHDNGLNYSWSVTDFDNPFAHVLQSQQDMYLDAEALLFWQSNRTFKQLVSSVGMFDSVWIRPLNITHCHINHILLLIGDSKQLRSVSEQESFLKFVEAFTQQWTLLYEIEREKQSGQLLKESLVDIQRSSRQQSHATDLSFTLIGKSEVMQRLREHIISAAESQLSVIIQGETGTGKELVAQAIHDFSPRKHEPFVAINCAAIPENLLESELFGYCKGAFSGADYDKQGLIAQANKGTLFLDEIGDMPLSLQAKLLRVLESRSYRPVGGKQEQTSDFRLVSATHVNLLEQVNLKSFRQDLYYRLFQYPLSLPRLASRLEDVEQLSHHFVELFNIKHKRNIRGLHYKALDWLKSHSYPGNVRELKHLVEYGCAQTSDGSQLEECCFANRFSPVVGQAINNQIKSTGGDSVSCPPTVTHTNLSSIDDLRCALNQFEEQIIRQRLEHYGGDREKAAKSLRVPKRTLAYKCQKLEIKR